MAENNERKLREELRAAVNEKDYSVAISKVEQMAVQSEEAGDQAKAREHWVHAARLFLEWAQAQRESRTYKNSAKSFVQAAEIYGRLGINDEAAQAVDLAAQDLVFAGDEYLVWKQPLGAAVCYSSAAILFILVSQEDKAQQVIDQVRMRIDALRHDSNATVLVDIPVQLKYAKDQLDIRLLNNVKSLIYSSLIPTLTNSGLSEFTSYIERTALGIESYINSSQQYPIINYELKLAGEVTIDEGFDIQVLITNTGMDTAYNIELEMVPKKEVTVVREFSKLKATEIPPNSTAALTWRCIVKSENVIEETQEINLSARLSFSDSKNLRQTLTISPIAFRTVSPQQQDQIKLELKEISGNVQSTREKILAITDKADEQLIAKIFDIFDQLIEQANGFIEANAVQNAKSWISLLQLQLTLIGDIPNQIKTTKDEEK